MRSPPLLDGWHGAAAAAFAEAWSDWLTIVARRSRRRCRRLADSLDRFQTDITQRDERRGLALGRLAERLS